MELYIILLIPCILILAICFYLGTPSAKGKLGEWRVKQMLGKTEEGIQYVIHDYILKIDSKTSQIDHILINRNGIFVIETKNYSGTIFGQENAQHWTQVLQYGRVKNQFYNPLKQNKTHIYQLSQVLPKNVPLYSVVVFLHADITHIEAQNVILAKHIQRYLSFFTNSCFSPEEMKTLYSILLEEKSEISVKEHVASIRNMQNDLHSHICPRCHGNLVVRNGKNGQFWGCENYPSCRFTAPIDFDRK